MVTLPGSIPRGIKGDRKPGNVDERESTTGRGSLGSMRPISVMGFKLIETHLQDQPRSQPTAPMPRQNPEYDIHGDGGSANREPRTYGWWHSQGRQEPRSSLHHS
jgi:hypothetical protein